MLGSYLKYVSLLYSPYAAEIQSQAFIISHLNYLSKLLLRLHSAKKSLQQHQDAHNSIRRYLTHLNMILHHIHWLGVFSTRNSEFFQLFWPLHVPACSYLARRSSSHPVHTPRCWHWTPWQDNRVSAFTIWKAQSWTVFHYKYSFKTPPLSMFSAQPVFRHCFFNTGHARHLFNNERDEVR